MAKRAEKKKCSVDGCSRNSSCRGWCKAHHKRWLRHGDPEGGRTPDGALISFVLSAVDATDRDHCIDWPYSLSGGYGGLRIDGLYTTAHRLVCERSHGAPPSPSHQAAHNCGNRKCCNPHHLRWATVAENHADKIKHGTDQRGERHPNAKLTETQIIEIRSRSGEAHATLARELGVTRSTVCQIRSGRGWSHV